MSDDGMTLEEAIALVELSRRYSWLTDRQITALRKVHAHLERQLANEEDA